MYLHHRIDISTISTHSIADELNQITSLSSRLIDQMPLILNKEMKDVRDGHTDEEGDGPSLILLIHRLSSLRLFRVSGYLVG